MMFYTARKYQEDIVVIGKVIKDVFV